MPKKQFGQELGELADKAERKKARETKSVRELQDRRVRQQVSERIEAYEKACRSAARKNAKNRLRESLTLDYFEATTDVPYRVHAALAEETVKRLKRDGTKAVVAYDTDRPVGSDPLYPYTRYGVGVKITF